MPRPTVEPKTIFARRLRALLKVRGISGAELARRVNWSQSLVSKWLADREPTEEQLLAVAACLEVDPEQLMTEPAADPEPEPPAAEPEPLPEPEPPQPDPPAPPAPAPPPEPQLPPNTSAFEKGFWRRAAALTFAVRYQFYSTHPLCCPICDKNGLKVMLMPINPAQPSEVAEGQLLFWVCPTVGCSYRTPDDALNTEVFFRIANEFPGFGPPGGF